MTADNGVVAALRRLVLNLLPKVALSRTTGLLARAPLPRQLRPLVYRTFARRYGVLLTEMHGELGSFRSLAAFFQRPLRPGARPLAAVPLVWPCDGRIVTAGPLHGERIEQVKGSDYALADLVGDQALARALAGGSQATIYLAPGDYHRVHAPFAGLLQAVRALPGTLFPVNPAAVGCIRGLFPRNARHVFHFRLGCGRSAAVVMVAAFNVGDTTVTAATGARLAAGEELGRFGFGSTVVAIVGAGEPAFAAAAPGQRVRCGADAL